MSSQYPQHNGPHHGHYQGWGQPPANTPPPPKRKTGRIIAAGAIGASLFLCIIVAVASAPDDSSGTAAPAETRTTQPAEKPTTADEKPVKEEAPAEKPKKEAPKAEEYGDGDYEVGVDIKPGTYISEGAKTGVFEFCSATTKPTDGSMPELESANANERVILTVGANSGIVSISGCEPFKRR